MYVMGAQPCSCLSCSSTLPLPSLQPVCCLFIILAVSTQIAVSILLGMQNQPFKIVTNSCKDFITTHRDSLIWQTRLVMSNMVVERSALKNFTVCWKNIEHVVYIKRDLSAPPSKAHLGMKKFSMWLAPAVDVLI